MRADFETDSESDLDADVVDVVETNGAEQNEEEPELNGVSEEQLRKREELEKAPMVGHRFFARFSLSLSLSLPKTAARHDRFAWLVE